MLKATKRVLTVAAVASLIAGGFALTNASAASAMGWFPRTTEGCGSKIVQLHWNSTGQIYLWGYNANSTAGPSGETLLIDTKVSGAHSYNSGLHTFTFAFGAAPGNVSSWGYSCVSSF